MTERDFTVAEKLFIILAWKANGMAMSACYESWSDHYARQNVKQYWKDSSNQLQGWKFDVADFQQLSVEQLKYLGFRNWEADMWLLPLWLVPQVNHSETDWFDLWGAVTPFNAETGLDNRGGCIARCFKHEPVPVLPEPAPERETLDQMFDDGLGHYPNEIDPANGEGTFTEAQLHAEAEAWADAISGGDDDEPVVHPFRDDEHQ